MRSAGPGVRRHIRTAPEIPATRPGPLFPPRAGMTPTNLWHSGCSYPSTWKDRGGLSPTQLGRRVPAGSNSGGAGPSRFTGFSGSALGGRRFDRTPLHGSRRGPECLRRCLPSPRSRSPMRDIGPFFCLTDWGGRRPVGCPPCPGYLPIGKRRPCSASTCGHPRNLTRSTSRGLLESPSSGSCPSFS